MNIAAVGRTFSVNVIKNYTFAKKCELYTQRTTGQCK